MPFFIMQSHATNHCQRLVSIHEQILRKSCKARQTVIAISMQQSKLVHTRSMERLNIFCTVMICKHAADINVSDRQIFQGEFSDHRMGRSLSCWDALTTFSGSAHFSHSAWAALHPDIQIFTVVFWVARPKYGMDIL